MIDANASNEATANHSKTSCYFYDGVLENLKYFAKKEESSVQAIIRRAVNKEVELLIQGVEQELAFAKDKVARLEARKAAEQMAVPQVESTA